MIEQSQAEFGVKSLCRVLKVSRSGYYDWLGRADSERQKANAVLKGKIQQIWQAKRQSYGYPRIHAELVAAGWQIGRKRVARLMQELGLQAKSPSLLSRKQRSVTQTMLSPLITWHGISKLMPRTRNG